VHFLLIYDVVDDYVAKRAGYRGEHLQLAEEFTRSGELLLGGALAEPVDRALLLFRSAESAKAFVDRDPYVRHGLVNTWSIRSWTTVAGIYLNR
jgi:uncharacterized protein